MAKLKTNKSVAKRFKFTKKRKLKRAKAYKRHILTKKTKKRKRNLRRTALVDSTDIKRVIRLLPYA